MKASRGKKSLTYKGRQMRFAADLSIESWQARKEWRSIQCAESEKYADKNSLSKKAVIQNRRRDQKFPKETKVKGARDH